MSKQSKKPSFLGGAAVLALSGGVDLIFVGVSDMQLGNHVR